MCILESKVFTLEESWHVRAVIITCTTGTGRITAAIIAINSIMLIIISLNDVYVMAIYSFPPEIEEVVENISTVA